MVREERPLFLEVFEEVLHASPWSEIGQRDYKGRLYPSAISSGYDRKAGKFEEGLAAALSACPTGNGILSPLRLPVSPPGLVLRHGRIKAARGGKRRLCPKMLRRASCQRTMAAVARWHNAGLRALGARRASVVAFQEEYGDCRISV
jgi:hypothetical protein